MLVADNAVVSRKVAKRLIVETEKRIQLWSRPNNSIGIWLRKGIHIEIWYGNGITNGVLYFMGRYIVEFAD